MKKRGQISFEYLIIMGFITFTIIGILGIAIFYSNTTKDKIQSSQILNCADKLISTAESVYYSGFPSKAIVNCYLPENIKQIETENYGIVITYGGYGGSNVYYAKSKVLISQVVVYDDDITDSGMKKFSVIVTNNNPPSINIALA